MSYFHVPVIDQETLAALTTPAATLRDAQDKQRFWEQLALEVGQDRTRLAQQLADQQAAATAQPRQTRVPSIRIVFIGIFRLANPKYHRCPLAERPVLL